MPTASGDERPGATRRPYDSPVRRQRSADTRERIVTAGSELVHRFEHWDWEGLTIRAVAAGAGVGERTVYRHFPTVRHLHDAVMQRLEEEAGVAYEEVTLANLAEVTAKVFATLEAFATGATVVRPADPTFAAVDVRRRAALRRSIVEAAPELPAAQREAAAAVLDVLWNLPAYEHLAHAWELGPGGATQALSWLIGLVVDAIHAGDGPATDGGRTTR
jgi:AcrR family transcriptional regulator